MEITDEAIENYVDEDLSTYDKKEKNTTTETTNFAINIHPNTKVSLVVMVEGLLSNGASKFYIFGIFLLFF